MTAQYSRRTEDLYSLVGLLPRFDYTVPKRELPDNAVYVFFERGEIVQWGDVHVDRIVRVGRNKVNGNFPARIRQHFGRVHSLGGDKNTSVFRKHVGGALLRRSDSADPRLPQWLKQMGQSFAEVEETVSRELRDNFTFTHIRVDDQQERGTLESALIALLAQFRLGAPTKNWLGRHAASDKIRTSGLWNEQHIDAAPLTLEQYYRIQQLIKVR